MSIKAKPSFSLKDQLFNADTVGQLAAALAGAHRGFKRRAFERDVLSAFPELELKARIQWIVTVLEQHLPSDYQKALATLAKALPAPLDPTLSDDDFGQFIWVVPGEFAAKHGCTPAHRERSLDFLRETTKRFSAESAIRPFLRDFPARTLVHVRRWTKDENYHVRRLASEGIRPFLPWAERVVLPVEDVLDVLTRLHADPTRYVTRSVANNLNDLTKLSPEQVIGTLTQWQERPSQQPEELDWMTRHALRTLLKKNDPAALALLGYEAQPRLAVDAFRLPGTVQVGGSLTAQVVLRSEAAQQIVLALHVHFLKANGRLQKKAFTMKKAKLAKDEVATFAKTVSFRPMTTRTLYPGTHRAEIVANGQVLASADFELLD